MRPSDKILQNCRRPSGFMGKQTIRRMNKSHAQLTEWGFSHIQVQKDAVVLDIGCGGGKALKKLSVLAKNGTLYGVDYSETSVFVAQQENRKDIKSGKMKIIQASVSELPFQDDFFDVITSVESYYFWPDLVHDFREVRRVLKQESVFVIVAEMYLHENQSDEEKRIVDVLKMHNHTPDELKALLEEAGFSAVEIKQNQEHGWLCAIAMK